MEGNYATGDATKAGQEWAERLACGERAREKVQGSFDQAPNA